MKKTYGQLFNTISTVFTNFLVLFLYLVSRMRLFKRLDGQELPR